MSPEFYICCFLGFLRQINVSPANCEFMWLLLTGSSTYPLEPVSVFLYKLCTRTKTHISCVCVFVSVCVSD